MAEAQKRVSVAVMVCAVISLVVSLDPEPPLEAECLQPGTVTLSVETGFTTRVACGVTSAAELRGPARLLFGQRLDVNHVSALALSVLPGIGPVRAAAVVREREDRLYSGLEDLRRVKGLGHVTVRAMEPWILFGPESQNVGQKGL